MAVVVEGYEGLKKALRNLAPNLARNMDKEIRANLTPIIADARAKVPSSIFGAPNNWSNYEGVNKDPKTRYFPRYNPIEVRKGLTYSMARQKRTKSGYSSMITLFNRDAAGQIAETAGRTNPDGRRSYHYVEVNKRFGGKMVKVRTTKDSRSDNPNAGKMMIERLDLHMGQLKNYKGGANRKTVGRLLYAAYAENQGKALDAIMKAIKTATDEFNKQSVLYDVQKAA